MPLVLHIRLVLVSFALRFWKHCCPVGYPAFTTVAMRNGELVLPVINALAYTAFLAFVVAQAVRLMRMSINPKDRTGLKTTHPELFDENGSVTKEQLLVVRFDRPKPVLPS